MNETIVIKPVGSYFKVDKNGYIINPASIENIQAEWLPAVEKLKDAYLEQYKEKLHSVYIRGSVAKGEAIKNISDIDSFAIVTLPNQEIDTKWSKEVKKDIVTAFPYIMGIEVNIISLDSLPRNKSVNIMIKTQSICVYGQNLADSIAQMKPGKDMTQHLERINIEISNTIEWLGQPNDDEKIKQKCSWIMKRVLRSGAELLFERSQKYTRDLYRCYEVFSEYYPEKKNEMYLILELAINPTADKLQIEKVLNSIGTWLAGEIKESNEA